MVFHHALCNDRFKRMRACVLVYVESAETLEKLVITGNTNAGRGLYAGENNGENNEKHD